MQNAKMPFLVAAAILIILSMNPESSARTHPKWFDPSRHLSLDKVKPGMKGYGLSVFSGTKIEKFDVEIVDVIRNSYSPNLLYGSKFDVILAKLTGKELERTGVISGMSGSPVYLRDPEDGKDKIVGAVAYGWAYHVRGPAIGGLQPIEQILAVDGAKLPATSEAQSTPPGLLTRRFLDALPIEMHCPEGRPKGRYEQAGLIRLDDQTSRRPNDGRHISQGLIPLAVPLAVSGLDPALSAPIANVLSEFNLAVVSGAGSGPGPQPPAQIEPAGVLGIPYVRGDVNIDAIGTVVERVGDRIWGFGHSMYAEGKIEMPLAAGVIQTIVPNQISSFKLGGASEPIGTLQVDQSGGVFGRIGPVPPMPPLAVNVNFAGERREYHYKMLLHRRLTPMLTLICVYNSVYAHRRLPELHTISYRGTMAFEKLGKIDFANTTSNEGLFFLITDLVDPIDIMYNNPFGRERPAKIKLDVEIKPETRSTRILQAKLDRPLYRPGEKARLNLKLLKLRGKQFDDTIEFKVPDDLPDGTYDMMVGGIDLALRADKQTRPHFYRPRNLKDLFALVKHVAGLKSERMYLAINDKRPGLGLARHTLTDLPQAKLAQLQDADPGLVAKFSSIKIFEFPRKYLVYRPAKLKIAVSRKKM